MKKTNVALMFFFIMLSCRLLTQTPIQLDNIDQLFLLKDQVAVFEDRAGNTTIEQIASGQFDEAFKENTGSTLNFGHLHHPVWLRLVLIKNIPEPVYLKSGNPNLDSLFLYGIGEQGISIQFAGSTQKASEKEIYSNDQYLLLDQAPHTQKTWYLRLRANITPVQLNGKIATLDTLMKEQAVDNLLFGFYLGMIVLVSLISFFWYKSFKDSTYLFYLGYNLFFMNTIFLITGYYSLFYPRWAIPSMNTYFPVADLLWVIFITAFTTRFLDLKKNSPTSKVGIRIIYGAAMILMVLTVLGFSALIYQIFEIFALLVSGFLIFHAVVCLKSGYWLARYYLAGFGSLILFGVLVIVTNFGLLPFMDTGYHGLKAGHTLEIVFFSLGLVHRAFLINRKKEKQMLKLNKIKLLFGQQVSKEIARQLLKKKGELPPTRRMDVSVLFLDIRNFTPFAESHTPEEVVCFQNTVFDPFIHIIDQHGGIITTLLGDGLMAVFGTPFPKPDHSQEAVRAGVRMVQTINELVEEGRIPPTKIGVGIHSGQVIVGNIGNEIRKEFSLSGVTVIIASRIEQLNKDYDTSCLISAEVYNRIDPSQFHMKSLGFVPLKGIEHALEIYSVEHINENIKDDLGFAHAEPRLV